MGGRKRSTRPPVPPTEISDEALAFVSDGLLGQCERENPFPFFQLVTEGFDSIYAAWKEHKDKILAVWISKHPCSRPSFWWSEAAPADGEGCTYKWACSELGHYYRRYTPEARFLQRHNLLTKAEERYLAKHPELLEQEANYE